MSMRRSFLIRSSGIAATPLLAALSACGGGDDEASLSDAELQRQMSARLSAQLNDVDVAATLLPSMVEVGFNWTLPTIAAAQIDTIIAYGFGNRPNAASGNTSSSGGNQVALPDPGPINEQLADAVYQIRRIKPVKVFAQWEIARFLVSKYQMGSADLTSIEPVVASDGSITYLSTDGVAAAIVQLRGTAAALGTVGIVGHRDHAKRCIQTSTARGIRSFAVQEVNLPVNYDLQSGQAWTRNRNLYLVHDMYAQTAVLSASLAARAYPNG